MATNEDLYKLYMELERQKMNPSHNMAYAQAILGASSVQQLEEKEEKPNYKLPIPKKIVAHLDKFVIGQDRAKRALATAAYFHYFKVMNGHHFAKSNICLVGPTGTGKTYILETLSKFLQVPFCVIDSTELTPDGYVGRDVGSFIKELVDKYGKEKAKHAIVFLDEADKLSGGSSNTHNSFKSTEIQQALLKLIEGKVTRSAKDHNRDDGGLDTTKMLFVIGGAFSSITKAKDYSGNMVQEDLIKHGLMPEFVGRFPVVTTLNALRLEDFIKIITTAENNVIDEYMNIFKAHDCALTIEDAAITIIAARAMKQGTGARAIRGVMDALMMDHLFTLPEKKTEKVEITLETLGVAV